MYLVITPLGIPKRRWLAGELARLGVAIGARRTLVPWPPIDTALRLATRVDRDPARVAAFERAWRRLCPDTPGEAWSIERDALAQLASIKPVLRRSMPSLELSARHRFGGRPARLHSIHVADPDDAELEAAAIDVALGARGSQTVL